MVERQRDMKVPMELVPKCPVCGAPMTMNLRVDERFVQDEGWYAAAERYSDFLHRHEGQHLLFLELGVGGNTPDIIAVNCCEAPMPVGRLLMNEPDLEAVSALCPDSVVIATHLDAVNHALLSSDDIRRFVAEKGLGNVIVPKNGEVMQF